MAKTSKKKSKKKPTRKKTTKKTSAKKKTTARKKTTRPSSKKAVSKTTSKRTPATTVEKLSGSVKKLMMANLGLYGQVLDELQSQASRASKVIKDARNNPSKVNKQLVKRGEELADQISDILKRSGAPATKQLEKQLSDLKKSIDKLKDSIKR